MQTAKSGRKEIKCLKCAQRREPIYCEMKEDVDMDVDYRLYVGRLYNIYVCTNDNVTIACKKCGRTLEGSLLSHHITCYVRNSSAQQLNVKYWGNTGFAGMDQDGYSITFGWSGIELYYNVGKTFSPSEAKVRIDYTTAFRIFPQLLFLNVDYFSLLKKLRCVTTEFYADISDIADILLETSPQCLFTGRYYDSFPLKHIFLQSFTGII